jgi:phage terminase small subunit
MAKAEISPKARLFIQEYLVDLNGTKAAIRAGYAKSGARQEGARLLAKAVIQEEIAVARGKMAQRIEVTQDMVMRELARIGFADPRTLFDDAGRLRLLHTLSADEAACLASVEVVTRTLAAAGDAPAEVERTHKVKMWDKVNALTQMGRKLGMFIDRHQHRFVQALEDMDEGELLALEADILRKLGGRVIQ